MPAPTQTLVATQNPVDLKTFFSALGRDHSDAVFEISKPLVAHA